MRFFLTKLHLCDAKDLAWHSAFLTPNSPDDALPYHRTTWGHPLERQQVPVADLGRLRDISISSQAFRKSQEAFQTQQRPSVETTWCYWKTCGKGQKVGFSDLYLKRVTWSLMAPWCDLSETFLCLPNGTHNKAEEEKVSCSPLSASYIKRAKPQWPCQSHKPEQWLTKCCIMEKKQWLEFTNRDSIYVI